MYNFDYELTSYETDEEYQNHFLKLFGADDIMSDEVTKVLDEIYNFIKDNEDWKKLLCILANNFFSIPMINQDMALPIAFSFTFMEKTHKCLQEFKNNGTTNLVKELIKNLERNNNIAVY